MKPQPAKVRNHDLASALRLLLISSKQWQNKNLLGKLHCQGPREPWSQHLRNLSPNGQWDKHRGGFPWGKHCFHKTRTSQGNKCPLVPGQGTSEHLVCVRLCSKCWDTAGGKTKIPALTDLVFSYSFFSIENTKERQKKTCKLLILLCKEYVYKLEMPKVTPAICD